jgi:hypothetical protein
MWRGGLFTLLSAVVLAEDASTCTDTPTTHVLPSAYADSGDRYQYEVKVATNVLPPNVLKGLLDNVDEMNEHLREDSIWDSGWVSFGAKRTNTPNHAMQDVVDYMKAQAPHSAEKLLEAEYWVQSRTNEEPLYLHYDVTEAHRTLHGVAKMPRWVSVLYLTDCGGPTVVSDNIMVPASSRGLTRYTLTHIYAHTHTHTHTHTHRHTHTHTLTNTYTQNKNTHDYTFIPIHMHTHIYTLTHSHTHTHTTHTHTHTHTHIALPKTLSARSSGACIRTHPN